MEDTILLDIILRAKGESYDDGRCMFHLEEFEIIEMHRKGPGVLFCPSGRWVC